MEKKRGLQRSLQGRHRLDRSVFRNVWGNVCSEAQVTPVCAHTCSEETQEFSANELDAEIYDHGVKRPTKPGLFRKVSEPPQSRWREIEASPLPHFITQVPESFAELTRERLLRGCIPALHGRGSSRGTLQCPSCRGKVYTRRVLLPWTPIFSIHMTSKKLKYLHKKGPQLLRVSSVDWYHDQGNTGGGCFTDFLSHPFTCPPASFVFLFFFHSPNTWSNCDYEGWFVWLQSLSFQPAVVGCDHDAMNVFQNCGWEDQQTHTTTPCLLSSFEQRLFYMHPSGLHTPFASFQHHRPQKNWSKLTEKEISTSILLLRKASSTAMLGMGELVPFTEAEIRSFSLLILASGPAETQGTWRCVPGVKPTLWATRGAYWFITQEKTGK